MPSPLQSAGLAGPPRPNPVSTLASSFYIPGSGHNVPLSSSSCQLRASDRTSLCSAFRSELATFSSGILSLTTLSELGCMTAAPLPLGHYAKGACLSPLNLQVPHDILRALHIEGPVNDAEQLKVTGRCCYQRSRAMPGLRDVTTGASSTQLGPVLPP